MLCTALAGIPGSPGVPAPVINSFGIGRYIEHHPMPPATAGGRIGVEQGDRVALGPFRGIGPAQLGLLFLPVHPKPLKTCFMVACPPTSALRRVKVPGCAMVDRTRRQVEQVVQGGSWKWDLVEDITRSGAELFVRYHRNAKGSYLHGTVFGNWTGTKISTLNPNTIQHHA